MSFLYYFLIFFGLFTLVYGLFSGAIIYHLRQYTLPGFPASKIIISLYIFLSVLFWFFSLTFLLKIPA